MKRSTIGRIRIECQRCGQWAETRVARIRHSGQDMGLIDVLRPCKCKCGGAKVIHVSVQPVAPDVGRTRAWQLLVTGAMPHAPKPQKKRRAS